MQAILDNLQITIIRPQGCLNAVNVCELDTVLNQSVNTIVLIDLQEVDFIDSAGLMGLVSGVKQAKQLNKRVCFCSVAPAHKIVFELAQLDRVFEIFDSGKILNNKYY